MADRLVDKVVLITGAARGQGAAEARMAAEEGAAVIVADVLVDEGEAVAAEIGGSFATLDVTSPDAWRVTVDEVVAEHGRLDGLVNNAGIFERHSLLGVTEDVLRRVTEVNQFGVLFGMQTAALVMVDQGGGSIVNISSVAGMRGLGSIAYVGSKWAVRGMTKSAARALAPDHVRVNSVHPGVIETPMLEQLTDAERETLGEAVPFGRNAEPEEVGAAVLFLLSDESSYITGAEIVVDGGLIV